MSQEQHLQGSVSGFAQMPGADKTVPDSLTSTQDHGYSRSPLGIVANISYILGLVFCLVALFFSYVMAERAVRVDYFMEWKLVSIGLVVANASYLGLAIVVRRILRSDFYKPAIWLMMLINMLALTFVTMLVAVIYAD